MWNNYIEDIRKEFRSKKELGIYRLNTIEIQNAVFKVDAPTIFGSINQDYIEAEIAWYESKSLNVKDLFELYGKKVAIWDSVSDSDGYINSNYGWCIYSKKNGNQYKNVKATLATTPFSRQACMYYTRPEMHKDAIYNGRYDHMCTTHVQYFVNDNYLECQVNMRSNDAIFGFINDVAWQKHVQKKLANDLKLKIGPMTWCAGSFHIYDRHYDLIK